MPRIEQIIIMLSLQNFQISVVVLGRFFSTHLILFLESFMWNWKHINLFEWHFFCGCVAELFVEKLRDLQVPCIPFLAYSSCATSATATVLCSFDAQRNWAQILPSGLLLGHFKWIQNTTSVSGGWFQTFVVYVTNSWLFMQGADYYLPECWQMLNWGRLLNSLLAFF